MTKGQDFIKKGRCKNKHCSSMSNNAWCDLNSKSDIIKLHDKGPNSKCKNQKLITFTPKQFQLEGKGFENTMKIFLRDIKLLGTNFLSQH